MRAVVPSLLVMLTTGCSGGDTSEGPEPILRRWDGSVQVVVVDSSEGYITLRGSNTRVVDATFVPTRDGDNFQAGLNAGRLNIGAVCQDGTRGCGMNIELDLPSDVEFEIVSDTGDVTIQNMGFVGSIRTVSGNVTGTRLQNLELTTEATLGADHDITYQLQPERVILNGGEQGDMRVALPPGEYNFDIETDGSITYETGSVSHNAGSKRLVQITTGSGAVNIAER